MALNYVSLASKIFLILKHFGMINFTKVFQVKCLSIAFAIHIYAICHFKMMQNYYYFGFFIEKKNDNFSIRACVTKYLYRIKY